MSEWITDIDDADFDAQVRQSDVPVLVDFWGEWCGPCKAMAPMLENLAREYAGKVKVVKVDMGINQKTALACHVRAAPTLLVFKHGTVQSTQVGLVSKADLVSMLDAALQ